MRYTVRLAEASDAKLLAGSMRPIDQTEVAVIWGDDIEGGVLHSIETSTLSWTVMSNEGELLMCFGVAPLPGEASSGSPWMLATTAFKSYDKELLRESRWYVNLMNRMYPSLFNLTHPDNHASIRWLTWCGFEFAEQTVEVKEGIHFLPFYRKF